MISKNSIYFGFFLAVFTAIAVIIILFQIQKIPAVEINSFEDCVKAGYPVRNDYSPRQCTAPSGRFFVEQLVKER